MATHWDWALRQAMERTDATHFCIHYDRKITKPGELGLLRDIAAEFPDDLITTMIDAVVNLSGRSRLGHTGMGRPGLRRSDVARCHHDLRREDYRAWPGASAAVQLHGSPVGIAARSSIGSAASAIRRLLIPVLPTGSARRTTAISISIVRSACSTAITGALGSAT